MVSAQSQADVDFKTIDAEILVSPESGELSVQATYEFELTAKVDSIFLDAVNLNVLFTSLNQKEIAISNSGEKIWFTAPTALGKHQLFIRYITRPKQTVYFTAYKKEDRLDYQVWTQGQGKYTSHWLPSLNDMNDKIEFDLHFLTDEKYEVISNGQLTHKFSKDSLTDWKFDMTEPMSSYLAAFVIGNFKKHTLTSNSGVSIALYYEPKDSLKVEPTYRYTKQIFDFLEDEIGVDYPWQNYKQVPVQDFLYAGMENTSCTIFSNQFMVDSTAFIDKNYVNVNAHELAHQWFGNLVTEVNGEHHWLHEGFATYYAYLAEKQLFGDDHFYWKLYDTAKTLHTLSENGEGEALTDPKAGSITFYEKGAWALVILREKVGDTAFKVGVENYLKNHAFKNVTINDFITEIEKASSTDLSDFKRNWLANDVFLWEDATHYLQEKCSSLKNYFVTEASLNRGKNHFEEFKNKWKTIHSDELKIALLERYTNSFENPYFFEQLAEESVKVRQAFAIYVSKVGDDTKPILESMLSDDSYVTQEAVLFKLWEAFPTERNKYLEQTKNIEGLPNKNLKQLWLTLALITPEYKPELKRSFYEELNSLTSTYYNFEIRQLAFQYLFQINALSDKSLEHLFQASSHHVWQFKKSSRNLIRQIVTTEEGRDRIAQLKSRLKKEEQLQLESILSK
ncbi:aminopeptidase [Croceivirga lutea]|uniref:M1 family metallopeptidase n=1 Tax=Croceivirga lutea TaxID=1775167 RepID=UPI001639C377|nr:M1 family metallopeptidase [Croceivirga lutea]GGG46096.1 aminopeptidase [Croceivirga lutea]